MSMQHNRRMRQGKILMKKGIHREMTIEDIFHQFPEKSQKLAQEMTNAGLSCVGCSAATFETVENGLMSHGMTDNEIEALIGRLNEILEQKVNTESIILTPKAAKKFLEILKEDGKTGWGLHLTEKPAGCNGYEYVLDFSEKALKNQEIFHSEGVEIHVDKEEIDHLLGCEIDYVDGLQGAGFKISNPNAKSSCGCGSSHGY